MAQKMDTLDSDCDRLEAVANEALDLLEEVSFQFNDLIQKHLELLDKTRK